MRIGRSIWRIDHSIIWGERERAPTLMMSMAVVSVRPTTYVLMFAHERNHVTKQDHVTSIFHDGVERQQRLERRRQRERERRARETPEERDRRRNLRNQRDRKRRQQNTHMQNSRDIAYAQRINALYCMLRIQPFCI